MLAEREKNGGVAANGTTDGVSCAADQEMKDEERPQTNSDDSDQDEGGSIKSGGGQESDVEMINAGGDPIGTREVIDDSSVLEAYEDGGSDIDSPRPKRAV